MGKELSNQVLIQVKKEMFSNVTVVMSDFAEWLERPDSSGVSELIEKLNEISASLNILGYAQASKLTDAIATSIDILKQKESSDLKGNSVDESTSSEVASALLVLENFIEQIDNSNNLDYGYLQRSYEVLDEVNQPSINLANLDMISSIDAKTYEIIAQNINEALSESRQKIEQYQGSEFNAEVIEDLTNRNNELINLFAALNIIEPQLLLKKTNELLQNVTSTDAWVDVAEAMLLVESAFVAGQKTSRLSQEDGSDLFEKQRSFNRQLVIDKVLTDIGGQAIYYVEQFRKKIVHDGAVKHNQDWLGLSKNVAYYQSVVSLSGLKRLSDVLEKLGVAFAGISLYKEDFPSHLFPPIIDALVGIEYLFDDMASAGNINEQDIQFLESAFSAINDALPVSQAAKEQYHAQAQEAVSVEPPVASVDSNLLSELDKGLDALEGNYIAPSSFNEDVTDTEEKVLNIDTASDLSDESLDVEESDELSADELGSEQADDMLVTEQIKSTKTPDSADKHHGVGAGNQSVSNANISNESNEVPLADDMASGLSDIQNDSDISSSPDNHTAAKSTIDAGVESSAHASQGSASSPSDIVPFGQYFNNKNQSDLDNIKIPPEKESFVKSHENAVEDDEFKEIFGEELNEMLLTLSKQVPLLLSEPEDLEHAKELRRSFHTLKGSGRMVGYEALGEFSWQHEQLFNNILDNQYSVNALVMNIVSEAYDLLNILGEGGSFEEKHGALLQQALVAEKAREALLEDKHTTNIDEFVNQLRFGIEATASQIPSDDSDDDALQSTQVAVEQAAIDTVSDADESSLEDDDNAKTTLSDATSIASAKQSAPQNERSEEDLFSLSESDFSSDESESIPATRKNIRHPDAESVQESGSKADESSQIKITTSDDPTVNTEGKYDLLSGASETDISETMPNFSVKDERLSSEDLFNLTEKVVSGNEVTSKESEATSDATGVEAGTHDLFSLADGDYVTESESISEKQDVARGLAAESADLDEDLFSLADESDNTVLAAEAEQTASDNAASGSDKSTDSLFTLADDEFIDETESSTTKDTQPAISLSEKTATDEGLFDFTNEEAEFTSDSEELTSTGIYQSGDMEAISSGLAEAEIEDSEKIVVDGSSINESHDTDVVDFHEQHDSFTTNVAKAPADIDSNKELPSTAMQSVSDAQLLDSDSDSAEQLSVQATGISPNSYRKILSSLKQTLRHEGESVVNDPSVVKALQYQVTSYGLPNDEKSLSELAVQVSADLHKDGFTADSLVSAVFEQPHVENDLPIVETTHIDDHEGSIEAISKRLVKGMSTTEHDEATAQALSNLLLTQWQKQGLETQGQQKEAALLSLVQSMTADASVDGGFLSNIVAKFNQKLVHAEEYQEETVAVDANLHQDIDAESELTVAKTTELDASDNASDIVETGLDMAKDDDVMIDANDEVSETDVSSIVSGSFTTKDAILQDDVNNIDVDAEISKFETELADSKKSAQENKDTIETQSTATNIEEDTSVKANLDDDSSNDVSGQEAFEEIVENNQLNEQTLSNSGAILNEDTTNTTHIIDEEDSVNIHKTVNVNNANITADDLSQPLKGASANGSDDNATMVVNSIAARKQRLDEELSQLAEHPTLKEAGVVASEEEKGEQAQAVYMRAVDKLESLSEMALKEPTEVGELIEAIYDIEDSLDTDSTPEWLWRILDAIEQLLIAFQNNEMEISEELAVTLRESVEMIQDYENHDGDNVDDLISKIIQERKNHGLISSVDESKDKFSTSTETTDLMGSEPVVDPNAGSGLTETFVDEALRLLATSQDDAEHWSEDLQQLSRLDGIRRNMHTLKGSALMANYDAIGKLAHTVESLIENVIEGHTPASSRAASLLIGAMWQGLLMLDNIQDGFMPKQDPYLLNNISAFLNEELPYPDIQAKLVEEKRKEQEVREDEQKAEKELTANTEMQQSVSPEASEEEMSSHGFDDSIDPVLVEIFNDEAQELIDNTYEQVNGDLKDKGNTDELKRSLHTLKGGARLVGIFSMGDMAHNMESVVENLEGYSDSKMRQAKTLLQMGTDALFDMLDTLSRRELPAATPALNDALSLFAETGQYKLPSKEELQTRQADVQQIENSDKKAASSVSDETVEEDSASKTGAVQSITTAPTNQTEAAPRATTAATQDMQSPVDNATPASEAQGKANEPEVTSELVKKAKPDDKGKQKAAVSDNANKNNASSSSTMPHFVRVEAKLLDDLIAMVGEMAILRSRLESLSNGTEYSISELSRVAVRIDEQTRRLDSETEAQMLFRHEKYGEEDDEFDPLELDRFSEMQQLSRQLAEAVDDFKSLNDSLQSDNALMRTITLQQSILQRNIQTSLTTTQMMRFDVHEPRLRRLVKQTTMSVDREAEFVLTGGEVELERRLLEDLLPALEHIMRNAISHGIEPPKERVAKGKPATGVIKVDVSLSAAELIVRVIDDGRGFDFDRIREKAAQKGILDEARQHDQQYLSGLIFKSGFSTAESLSQISGRGVGMDVVSEIVKQRRGRVSAQSIPGKGTEFVINMPFSMSISEVLLVEVAGQVYAAPMSSIAAISQVSADKLQKVLNGETVYEKYNNLDYRLFVLGQYFSPEHYELLHENSSLPVLFINSGSETVGFHIDRILNRVEIVVKNVNRQILNIPGISGATILGDGSVVPVLELLDLSRRIVNITPIVEEQEEKEEIQRSILVVDDSVTMRKVATRLLERHEFNVMAAKDGLDAIEVLEDFSPDLILLDIEMPRMDGFEFAAHVRQAETFKDVPIIMITSRTGDKHRERADKIGVQGYLGKPYREDILIETIKKMLEEKKDD